jgi:flagellar hook assembly protein FlgD
MAQPLSGGRINFVVTGEKANGFSLNIFSINGSLIKSFSQNKKTDCSFIWDGASSEFKPVQRGVYVVQVRAGNDFRQIKLFLER